MRPQKRFTIYDAMEANGAFDKNSANATARDAVSGRGTYARQLYPKMFYHPKGEEREITPGEWVSTPMGNKLVGRQTELIYAIAENATDERQLRAQGWHDHPAKAMKAAGKEAPATGAAEEIQRLQDRIAELEAQKAGLELTEVAAVEADAVLPENPLMTGT